MVYSSHTNTEGDLMHSRTLYKRSKRGLVANILADQRTNSKRRGHIPPSYSLNQLLQWADEQAKFHGLHALWVESNYDRWERPSFNRLDNTKPYSLGNIEIITAYHNLKLEKLNPKPVRRSDGKQYVSILAAERENGYPEGKSKISLVCRGKRKSYKSFTWEFVNKGDMPL